MSDTAAATTTTRPKRWYIVHAYSNFEKKVAESIREQAKQRGLEDHFEQVMVPTRDGVRLATDIYLPGDSGGSGGAGLLRAARPRAARGP